MSTNHPAPSGVHHPPGAAPYAPDTDPDLNFDPVVMRQRADGWLPERQVEFIAALAECGCVEAACARVGMSAQAAYTLRRRADAKCFRRAWDGAVAFAIRRLSDAGMSRALHGVTRPVFYKGELVGERRYYDERLTQFLLRYNDPGRYGRWRDRRQHADQVSATTLQCWSESLEEEAWDRATGYVPPDDAEPAPLGEDIDDCPLVEGTLS